MLCYHTCTMFYYLHDSKSYAMQYACRYIRCKPKDPHCF